MKEKSFGATVTELNSTVTKTIIKEIEEHELNGSDILDYKLRLIAVEGTLEYGLDIAQAAHSASKVDLIIEASGANGPSGTIVCAAGKPGYRTAHAGTTFILNHIGEYEEGTKPSGLEDEDKLVYETLSALTGKRKAILEAIVKGAILSAIAAKKCGIIDSVSAFRSKYVKARKSAKTTSPEGNASDNNDNELKTTVTQGTNENSVLRPRGRRKVNPAS